MTNVYIRILRSASLSLKSAVKSDSLVFAAYPNERQSFLEIENPYTFTFIRNPYDRIVSIYSMIALDNAMRENKMKTVPNITNNTSFEEFLIFVKQIRSEYKNFTLANNINQPLSHSFIHNDPAAIIKDESVVLTPGVYWILLHTETMVDTLEYFLPIDNINFIGRFENLTSDFEKLKNKLQLKTNIKHHHKTTFRKKYTEYYNTNTYDLVTELYADDIKKFNYSYDC